MIFQPVFHALLQYSTYVPVSIRDIFLNTRHEFLEFPRGFNMNWLNKMYCVPRFYFTEYVYYVQNAFVPI